MTFPPLGGARGGNPGGDCPPGRGRRHRNLCQCAHWRTVNGRLPRHGGRALPHLFWLPRYARRGVLGEQAAAPPPPMDRAAAVRGAAILGRPILNRALCRPAKGRRKAQRRRGGARSRGPLCLPRCKYGPRGGEALRRTSFLFPLHVTAVRIFRMRLFRTWSKKRPPQGPYHGDHISPFSA